MNKEQKKTEVSHMKSMIADYLEQGFLENIIDMFRHDRTLYPLIGDLMADERMRVRLGVSALVETLAQEDSDAVRQAIPGIARLCRNPNPTIRGDAAYLLGIIGHPEALPFLKEALGDENPDVREAVMDAIDRVKEP